MGLGFFFVALAVSIQKELVPAGLLPWIESVIVGLGGSLAAMGVYDLVKRMFVGR